MFNFLSHICACVFTCVSTLVYMFTYIYMCVCELMCVCSHIFLCVVIFTYVYVWVHVCVCAHVYVCSHTCICVCVCSRRLMCRCVDEDLKLTTGCLPLSLSTLFCSFVCLFGWLVDFIRHSIIYQHSLRHKVLLLFMNPNVGTFSGSTASSKM